MFETLSVFLYFKLEGLYGLEFAILFERSIVFANAVSIEMLKKVDGFGCI